MSLFQPSVLKKYLRQQDTASIQKAYKKYNKYFHNTSIQENIRNSKEKQFQEGFLRELFVSLTVIFELSIISLQNIMQVNLILKLKI